MDDRQRALRGAVTPQRAARAEAETAAFTRFRARLGLPDSTEAVLLYLASLLDDDHATGSSIRERLRLVDLARRLAGATPWLDQPDVRTFLVGLHAEKPTASRSGGYDPLYLELVYALLDAARQPTAENRRAHAAQLLRRATGCPTTTLARLTWDQVHLTTSRVTVTVDRKVGRGRAQTITHTLPARNGHPDCPVAALRLLRGACPGHLVFGGCGTVTDVHRLARALALPDPLALPPAAHRDAAMLLLGYAAGLRTHETRALRTCDVRGHDRGLVLAIPGRRRLTYVPSVSDAARDPRTAWETWLTVRDGQGFLDAEQPAFLQCSFSRVWRKPLTDAGLNYLVRQRAEQAGLSGRYVWTSLRTGMMRTALRAGHRAYSVAHHADLVSLTSVQRHEEREHLLDAHNVASQLGL